MSYASNVSSILNNETEDYKIGLQLQPQNRSRQCTEFTNNQQNEVLDIDVNNNNIRSNEATESESSGKANKNGQQTRNRSNSVTSTESVTCRICHEGDNDELLLSMCHCSGTMGLMHKSCMERWLSAAGNDVCEICGFNFKTKRSKKSFSEWLVGESSKGDRQNLLGDCACFLVLTPLASISTWLCISGAKYYYNKGTYMANWETWGLVILTVLLVLIYFTWCLIAIKYHIQTYFVWQERNQTVRVLSVSVNDKAAMERCPWSRDDSNSTDNSSQVLLDMGSLSNSEEFTVMYAASRPRGTLSKDQQSFV